MLASIRGVDTEGRTNLTPKTDARGHHKGQDEGNEYGEAYILVLDTITGIHTLNETAEARTNLTLKDV